jgi:hypothetical protein
MNVRRSERVLDGTGTERNGTERLVNGDAAPRAAVWLRGRRLGQPTSCVRRATTFGLELELDVCVPRMPTSDK